MANAGRPLNFEWVALWRALSASAARCASVEAFGRPRVMQLSSQAVNMLNFAAVHSDALLPVPEDGERLIGIIVGAKSELQRLTQVAAQFGAVDQAEAAMVGAQVEKRGSAPGHKLRMRLILEARARCSRRSGCPA